MQVNQVAIITSELAMELENIGWYLAYVEISGLNTAWLPVLNCGIRHTWRKGHACELGKSIFFIKSGCVSLRQMDYMGNEKILWHIKSNSIFGEAPFFCEALNTGSHVICSEESQIYSFDRKAFQAIFNDHPELHMDLIRSMAYKLRILAHQTGSLVLDNLLVRLCKLIAQHLVKGSDPLTAQINMHKHEIANFIGANRISLYKILKDKEEEGLWGPLKKGRIVIHKPDIFFRIASS